DAGQDGAALGAAGQEALHRELAGPRDVGHVAGVGLARVKTPVPTRVVPGIDGVQTDGERQSFGHASSCWNGNRVKLVLPEDALQVVADRMGEVFWDGPAIGFE